MTARSQRPTIIEIDLAALRHNSHALQAAAADYCRNAYLYFAKGKPQADFDSYSALLTDYRKLDWLREPWDKLLLAIYLNATREQEILSPTLRELYKTSVEDSETDIPRWLQKHYRASVRPTFRLWGFLMTNTRMIFLFLFLLIDQPAWFFWIELTVFNFLFIFLLLQQERKSKSLLSMITARREPA